MPELFNDEFESYGINEVNHIITFLKNLEFQKQAKREIRIVRKVVKSWLKQGQSKYIMPSSVPR